jgi:hypothetical protein
VSFPDYEAFWSARYRDAGDDYLFGIAPNKFLVEQAEYFGDGVSVLSVADGEGRNAVWLAEQGCAVTATEISSVALEKAAKLARGRHVATTEAMAGPRSTSFRRIFSIGIGRRPSSMWWLVFSSSLPGRQNARRKWLA